MCIRITQAPMESKLFRSPILVLALLLAGCGAKDSKKDPPTPEVGYVVVTTQSAPLDIELAGRTTAYETSEVRPQVSGVIKARRFQEGAIVHAGQTLYEIDPSLYRAAAAQAQANLANAEAARDAAEAKADRYRPLADIEASASRTTPTRRPPRNRPPPPWRRTRRRCRPQASTWRSPGCPPRSPAGSAARWRPRARWWTNGQADALTTIQRLDPIFVDVQQSSADLVALRRSLTAGGVTPASAAVG
jgi:membrane fusion protein (multidrug efflux system)